MNKTILISFPIEELQTVIIDCVNSCLKTRSTVNNLVPKASEEAFLNVKETAQFLNLTVPTIYSKVSKRELPFMKRSKRLYFSKKELIEYLKEGRHRSNKDISNIAESYIQNTK